MSNIFKEIKPELIMDNPFKLIGSDWMLITAGNKGIFQYHDRCMGRPRHYVVKNVAWCVIRPNRHTYKFIEEAPFYTLSFLEEQYRDILTYCGTKSGRDVNKIAETGLTPVFDDNGIYFAEARLVLECKKIYFQDILPENFLSEEIEEYYPQKDYHRMYFGEIVKALAR